MRTATKVTLLLLAAGLTVGGLLSLVLHKTTTCVPGAQGKNSCIVVRVAADMPIVPKRVKMVDPRDYNTPIDRIRDVFWALSPPPPEQPENTWAYARRNDG